jgi:hypothetical protein
VTRNPLHAPKAAVQTLYTEQHLSAIIRAQKDAGKSLRAIAAQYGEPVNHADIERILQGRFPRSLAKRAALKLLPVCPECAQPIRRQRILPEWVTQAVEFLKDQKVLTEFSGSKTESNMHKTQRVYTRDGRAF